MVSEDHIGNWIRAVGPAKNADDQIYDLTNGQSCRFIFRGNVRQWFLLEFHWLLPDYCRVITNNQMVSTTHTHPFITGFGKYFPRIGFLKYARNPGDHIIDAVGESLPASMAFQELFTSF